MILKELANHFKTLGHDSFANDYHLYVNGYNFYFDDEPCCDCGLCFKFDLNDPELIEKITQCLA